MLHGILHISRFRFVQSRAGFNAVGALPGLLRPIRREVPKGQDSHGSGKHKQKSIVLKVAINIFFQMH